MTASVFTFRKCLQDDISRVINFCNENGFTKRAEEEWIGGGIEAALAFHDTELVGAFPFFKRQIFTNDGSTVTCGYFTAVAIHEDYRSAGLGSKLLSILYQSFGITGMFVNSNEDDRAFRWYMRNGYDQLNNVTMYSANSNELVGNRSSYFVREITNTQLSDRITFNLKLVFDSYVAGFGGFETRELDFWNKKLKFHYYRSYNRYFLLTDKENEFNAYTIAVISSYPGRPVSVDILELACRSLTSLTDIITAVAELAEANNITPVRIPLEESSLVQSFLLDKNFVEDWSFCMLYHPLSCSADRFKPYKYFHFDYA